MKKLFAFPIVALCFLTQTASAVYTDKDYVRNIASYIHYAETNQDKVWPGFHPASTPSVIFMQNGSSHAYGINFQPGALPWVPIDLSPDYPVYFLEDASSINPYMELNHQFITIDGQRVYVDINYEDELIENEKNDSTFMWQRAVHYLINESPVDAKNFGALNITYDSFNDLRLLKLLYLEDAALNYSQQVQGEAAETALRDAVAIHQYRQHLLSRAARKYENVVDILAGVPMFIAWSSENLSEENYSKMTQRTGCVPLNALMDPMTITMCAMNQFPTYSNSVYAHALDKKLEGIDWKTSVITEFKSIPQVIMGYYHLRDWQAKRLAKKAMLKSEYHYERIDRVIDNAMLDYTEKMAVAKDEFYNAAGIELRAPGEWGGMLLFTLLFGGDIASGWYYTSNKMILLEDVSDSNADSLYSDFIYEFDHEPYVGIEIDLSNFDSDSTLSSTLFKLTREASLEFDGQEVSALDFVTQRKSQSYKELQIKDAHMKLKLITPGTLDGSDGSLRIIQDELQAWKRSTKLDLIGEMLYQTKQIERLSASVSANRSSAANAGH